MHYRFVLDFSCPIGVFQRVMSFLHVTISWTDTCNHHSITVTTKGIYDHSNWLIAIMWLRSVWENDNIQRYTGISVLVVVSWRMPYSDAFFDKATDSYIYTVACVFLQYWRAFRTPITYPTGLMAVPKAWLLNLRKFTRAKMPTQIWSKSRHFLQPVSTLLNHAFAKHWKRDIYIKSLEYVRLLWYCTLKKSSKLRITVWNMRMRLSLFVPQCADNIPQS